MEQYVVVLKSTNEKKINAVLKEQREKGYKAISITSSRDNWAVYTVIILFEKIK